MNNVITYKKERKSAQELAWLLIVIFCFSLFSPGVSLAGGGGPTQPEVQGFTPIGVSDMVDPFTGDFTYNIPLMDVEGYPINIGYNSGVTMDQEASWVGLGWNLNVGSILRNMRGIPDDFNGEKITKTTHSKPQLDISASVDLSNFEVFGKEIRKKIEEHVGTNDGFIDSIKNANNSLSVNAGLRINYSNYTGWGTSVDFGSSFNLKNDNKTSSFGLNLTGSSENGSGFSPSVSLAKKVEEGKHANEILNNSFGAGFNSRAGLSHFSYVNGINKFYGIPNWSKTMARASYNSGLRHYMPSSNPRYSSKNFTGSVTTSATILATDGQIKLAFTVNESNIDEQYQTMSSPAFGYFNLNAGQRNNEALLDFNRDHDGTFTKYTPFLASAFLTSDLFNVQAQGVGGSFRGYRNEVGYVFDPISTTTSVSGSLGYEFGLGDAFDDGFDVGGSLVSGYAGVWNGNSNEAVSTVKYETSPTLYENFALQDAGERSVDTDSLFGTTFSKYTAENFNMDGPALLTHLQDKIHNTTLSTNNRVQRIKRNELISFLTVSEVRGGMGISNADPNLYTEALGHHIGEITQLGTDGRRYVFGLPAYNTYQEEVTMAVGESLGDGNEGYFPEFERYNGLVSLTNEDEFNKAASTKNKLGIDHHYSEQKIPAYAHAYLLTAVLSDDYIDSDAEKGPSENDMGSYVKVDYRKVEDVRWRSPMNENNAYFNEGLKSDKKDDKASFVYGTKELYYVKKIETKNYVAVFFCEDRLDGTSAASRNGGLDPTAGKMMCLKKICLYTKKEFTDHESDLSGATALQEVHFVYDYSLCPGYIANATGGGKLTLKEIYFAYQGSYKMKRSSYKFEYDSQNAAYNMKAIDRWGTYQPTGSGALNYENAANPLPQGDFPYTTQNKSQADANARQWALTGIYLPSGGKMEVEYESDDYAYVQNLPASQMFPIVATSDVSGGMNVIGDINAANIQPISTSDGKNRAIYFKLKDGSTNIDDYAKYGNQIYFKCLVNVAKSSQSTNKWEYVSGYGFIESITKVGSYGKIVLQPTKLLDHGGEDYSPITKAAIQFARMHLSRTIYDVDVNGPDNTSENGLLNLLGSMAGAFASFEELAVGPNIAIYDNEKCQEILTNRSFIRLYEPSKRKLGGGARVKTIKMYDNWKKMSTDGAESSADFNYGQEFVYQLEDGTSSGVASYEPAIGGDENSMVRPKMFDDKIIFAPDNNMYIETPIMESQFPNPSVGYSRVEIHDLKPTGVSSTRTGKVVKEFYTAKDFPVITKSTNLDHKMANSFLPFSPQYEYMTASQGFYVELNDMHGKPKSEAVYAENKTLPISSVEYEYLKTQEVINGLPGFKLNNTVTTVRPNGTTSTAEIGVKYEAVADFRETSTQSIGVGPIDLNLNGLFAGPFFVVVPSIWAQIDLAEDRFRTATLNKVVNKFGIVNKVTANQDGSIVETKNLAYDSETGEVLATQTTNNFNDAVYSLNFPAHWKYDQLGMAYKNIGYTVLGHPIFADGFMPMNSTLSANFVEGDEVIVTKHETGNPQFKGWVTEVASNGIRIVDKAGNAIVTSDAEVKIIRSGRRNKQMLSMASITSNNNPLGGLTTGTYKQVLNAGAVELSQDWGTYCDCFDGRLFGFQTKNPYVKGTLGNWRPVRSYTYLTERTQSNTDNNTNIRLDGTFAGFSPYYFYNSGQWSTNPSNWTFISEVTQFSPNGTTLETKDALGRYSASLFSFKNTLTTGIAANAMLNQLAEGSFEDLVYANCMDRGIFSKPNFSDVSTSEAHSGRNSLYVSKGHELTFGEVNQECTIESTCNMSITALSATTYSVTGSPSDLSVVTVSGTGSATLTGSTVSVSFTNTAYFELVADIVNKANGCKMRVKFFNTPGNLEQLNVQVLSIGQN